MSAVSQKLQVTGVAVPAGATGVLLNVTVVGPSAAGYLSVRPGDASGAPSTSSLNFNAGDVVPNAVQVGLPTAGANAGKIDITYDAFGQAGPTTEVLIDVVGYMAGTPGPSRILLGTGTLNIPAGGFVFGTIYCPPGYVAVGTGFNTSGSQNFVKIYGSDRMGYFLSSTFSFATSVDAQVVCMSGLTNAALSVESSDEASWQSDLESMKLRFAEEMSLQSGE